MDYRLNEKEAMEVFARSPPLSPICRGFRRSPINHAIWIDCMKSRIIRGADAQELNFKHNRAVLSLGIPHSGTGAMPLPNPS